MSKFRRVLLALFLITLVSSEVMAKTIVDTTKSNKTKVKEMNGTTVIDIDTPNSNGVSVNYFKHFDVEKNGTVLNNSNSDYVTSKGLKISKNENLSSNEAKVALLKVNGTEKSALKGLLEAASGSELDVYISNENGLVVDGLTLENIRKAVLTTGKIDDNLNITVEKGDIRITKNGLSGSKFIDLLTVKLINEGKIKANDEVRVILGSNNNDAKVDASKLGSMYSNKITISSPNKFLNVDTHELLSKENTNIDIQGELTNKGTIASEKNVTIKAKNISNEGKVDFSKGGYEIKWITPDGKVFSLEDINSKWKKKYHKSLTPSDTFLANAGKTLSGFVYDINFTKKNVDTDINTNLNADTNRNQTLSVKKKQFDDQYGLRDEIIFQILKETEIRISELAELNIQDFDLRNQRFYVYRTKQRSTWITMSEALTDLIKRYLEERSAYLFEKDAEAMFLVTIGRYKGARLGVRSIERIVSTIRKRQL